MGNYLNSKRPYNNYAEIAQSAYFVDKSSLLYELLPIVDQPHGLNEQNGPGKSPKYLCITRPRRFGKTVMANMIAAYFGKGQDSRELFCNLQIASHPRFAAHLNQHNVICLSFHEMPRNCKTYQQYIDRIQDRLLLDLQEAFPDAAISMEDALWDAFNTIYEKDSAKFIFVLDEWDFIFHRKFVTNEDRTDYLDFLNNLLKDQPYVELTYMTGILPITKYSSGSELNMFCEYTMVTETRFSQFFGFTESEVDTLFDRYQTATQKPAITRNDLRKWYDGYHTHSGERVYNPRSVVLALTNNNLGNYWTSAGPYDEIFYYIEHNVDAVREALALMVSGIPISTQIREYAATSTNLTTKDEIFSAMVVYGFLNYEAGKVSIPNRELMNQFDAMLQKESSLGYVFRLAKESQRMLEATLSGDTQTMCEILEYAHNSEIPLLSYNREEDLTVVITLVYLAARNQYDIRREDKAGIGYVDFVFLPEDPRADGILLELKVNAQPEDAIQQIRERQYILRFDGKLGEKPRYTGRIQAVGIAYDKKTKKHSCIVETLRESI